MYLKLLTRKQQARRTRTCCDAHGPLRGLQPATQPGRANHVYVHWGVQALTSLVSFNCALILTILCHTQCCPVIDLRIMRGGYSLASGITVTPRVVRDQLRDQECCVLPCVVTSAGTTCKERLLCPTCYVLTGASGETEFSCILLLLRVLGTLPNF